MKRILFLAIAFMAMTVVHAQQNDTTIVFNKMVHDFGEIVKGVPQTFSFEFQNKGKEVLTIESVRASCGCTSPSWTKEPVKPGKKGYVSATYNAAAKGVFSKTLTVVSNGTPNVITLQVKGKVIEPETPPSESK